VELLKNFPTFYGDEDCMYDIGGKARRRETTRKTKM
jgi:hypothetical protein